MSNQWVKLRYDGRYDWITDQDNRQWTVVNHYLTPNGMDYFESSLLRAELQRLGIIPPGQP